MRYPLPTSASALVRPAVVMRLGAGVNPLCRVPGSESSPCWSSVYERCDSQIFLFWRSVHEAQRQPLVMIWQA